jgi:hypothetical protein
LSRSARRASWQAFRASDSDIVLSPARSRSTHSFMVACFDADDRLLEVELRLEVELD